MRGFLYLLYKTIFTCEKKWLEMAGSKPDIQPIRKKNVNSARERWQMS